MVRSEGLPEQWKKFPIKTRQEIWAGLNGNEEMPLLYARYASITVNQGLDFLRTKFHTATNPYYFGVDFGWEERVVKLSVHTDRSKLVSVFEEPVEEFISEHLLAKLLLILPTAS
jgi:hypothetical protein